MGKKTERITEHLPCCEACGHTLTIMPSLAYTCTRCKANPAKCSEKTVFRTCPICKIPVKSIGEPFRGHYRGARFRCRSCGRTFSD